MVVAKCLLLALFTFSTMCLCEKIDLHMHSTISDGTDAPRVLMQKALEMGLTTVAVTDHDIVRTPVLFLLSRTMRVIYLFIEGCVSLRGGG